MNNNAYNRKTVSFTPKAGLLTTSAAALVLATSAQAEELVSPSIDPQRFEISVFGGFLSDSSSSTKVTSDMDGSIIGSGDLVRDGGKESGARIMFFPGITTPFIGGNLGFGAQGSRTQGDTFVDAGDLKENIIGSTQVDRVMLGVSNEWETGTGLNPYIGAFAGIQKSTFHTDVISEGTKIGGFSGSNTSAAWEALAGVNIDIVDILGQEGGSRVTIAPEVFVRNIKVPTGIGQVGGGNYTMETADDIEGGARFSVKMKF